MFEARAFRHIPLPSLFLFALIQAACTPALHTVRLETADGRIQTTTPRPRPPLALPKEEARKAVRVLARNIVPVADPVEFAREKFEVPVREGVYLFNPRTKELKPADKATKAAEEPAPELIEQARRYLQWCANRHQPGDCLGALHGGRTLDAYGRYVVTMGIAIAGTFEATGESLEDMLSVREVLGMVVAGVTMYAVLWVLPEPTSKGIAAAVTIVLVGYLGVNTLYTLGRGWSDLIDRADAAVTFDALRDAGEDYAKVMGADTARILVMVAAAAVGSGVGQLVKLLPTLPGAGPASELAVAEGGVALGDVGAVESVQIAKGGLTISLTTGAVLSASLSGNFGRGPRINLLGPSSGPKSIAERVRALKDTGVRGDLDKLEKRIRGGGAEADGALEELEAIERWLTQGIKGDGIEALEESNVPNQKNPDFRVRGELTEIKTRDLALDDRWVSDAIYRANKQIRGSGLDASRPMIGVEGQGPQGQVELQLRGRAAQTGAVNGVEVQVLKEFNPGKAFNLRRVAVYSDGKLIGEWVRTAANAVVRTFPL